MQSGAACSGKRASGLLALLVPALLAGCATRTYTSSRPAAEVSACIAEGWRKSPRSGYELPVSLTRTEQHDFVGVELHPTFPSLVVTGSKHPFHPVWAEVSDAVSGSSTLYHRAYQFAHETIDRVVVECQEPR